MNSLSELPWYLSCASALHMVPSTGSPPLHSSAGEGYDKFFLSSPVICSVLCLAEAGPARRLVRLSCIQVSLSQDQLLCDSVACCNVWWWWWEE
jgi:hypothetical protein